MKHERLNRIFLLVSAVFLGMVVCLAGSGCGLTRQCVTGEPPVAENLPVRELATVVVSDESANQEDVENLVREANEAFYEQTGIRLVVKDRLVVTWQHSSRHGTLQELVDNMKTYGKPFDIAIGFYEMGPLDRLEFNLVGGWAGVIDDVYRRFVVVRRDNLHALVHELGHIFLFDHKHTGGVMSAYTVCMVGDHICNNYSICFSEEDRKEIVRNKWRDFSVKPELSEREDLIEGFSYNKTWLGLVLDLFKWPFTRPADDSRRSPKRQAP